RIEARRLLSHPPEQPYSGQRQQYRGDIAAAEMVADQLELSTVAAVPPVPHRLVLFQALRDGGPQIRSGRFQRRVAATMRLADGQPLLAEDDVVFAYPIAPRRHVQRIRSGASDDELPDAVTQSGKVGVPGGIVQMLHARVKEDPHRKIDGAAGDN